MSALVGFESLSVLGKTTLVLRLIGLFELNLGLARYPIFIPRDYVLDLHAWAQL